MKPFRTTLNAVVLKCTLNYTDSFLTIGSCFSDAIGKSLAAHKIHTCINPFGTLYNPHAIHKAIGYMIDNSFPDADTFTTSQGLHLNFDFHSRFSSPDKKELDTMLRSTVQSAHDFLKNASVLILTYGTSFVYAQEENGNRVANCHKIPSKHFRKKLMTQGEIVESFQKLYTKLKSFNPTLQLILTVSPVRHLKDTLELNAVSKSILRTSCHAIQESIPDVYYFPSYEIMLDDLRDYRFYRSDMIHPTEEAEGYIWDAFKERFFDADTIGFINKWDDILHALSHKPFHPSSPSHQQFIRQTILKLEALKPFIGVDKEIESLTNQLIVD